MLEITEADILRSLEKDNTWWVNEKVDLPSSLRTRAYLKSFIQVALNWNVNRSVILMGPRRVGKTVMLGQLIAYALSNKTQTAITEVDNVMIKHNPCALYCYTVGRNVTKRLPDKSPGQ